MVLIACCWAGKADPVSAADASSQPAALSAGGKRPPPASAFAGDAACRSCHAEEAATYAATAHHRTSSLPSAGAIEGSFTRPTNLMRTANPNLGFMMTSTDQGFFQSAIDISDPDHPRHWTEPFGIVVGSGRKAHTYLFWKDDQLFELPVSYWKPTREWINSPGYPDGYVHFDKAIVPRCLDCHGSYFESLPPPLNRYRKSSLVLGITCEKCHGPGLEHAARERSPNPPGRGSARIAIVNPAHLPRDRQMDLCSLCHAGAATPIAQALSFRPGDRIDEYLKIHDPVPGAPVDVHGTQVLTLRRSKCFVSSQMTCSTCHDVHRQQRDAASFSPKCLSCHQIQACGKYASMGEAIRTKCIDCHMPLQQSEALFSETNGDHIAPLVRNHRIAVYPDISKP